MGFVGEQRGLLYFRRQFVRLASFGAQFSSRAIWPAVTNTPVEVSYNRMPSPARGSIHPARFALLIAAFSLCAFGQPSQSPAPTQRQPVLVELFTSEGCSDCPPADALLGRLDATQFVPGAQAIVLSEHVTYWNHQGWHDPFSFDAIDQRQQDYVTRFALQSNYTPQMVVDGVTQFVGSDLHALTAAVASAAANPKQALAIENARWENGTAYFSARSDTNSSATLFAALAADATHSEVARGENAGRTLHHVAVVRVLKDFGSKSADGRPLKLSSPDASHAGEPTGPVRLVVFLVDRKNAHVLAVAEQTLTR